MDRVEIGAAPHEEKCAQFGDANYYDQVKVECRIFAGQIARLYGTPPEGCTIKTRGSNYNGDSYYEVVVNFDGTKEGCVDYAFAIENDEKKVLGRWDEQGRTEMIEAGLLQAA